MNIISNRTLLFIILKDEGTLFLTYKISLEYLFSNSQFNFSKVINFLVFEEGNEIITVGNTIYLYFIKLDLGVLFK